MAEESEKKFCKYINFSWGDKKKTLSRQYNNILGFSIIVLQDQSLAHTNKKVRANRQSYIDHF